MAREGVVPVTRRQRPRITAHTAAGQNSDWAGPFGVRAQRICAPLEAVEADKAGLVHRTGAGCSRVGRPTQAEVMGRAVSHKAKPGAL